MIIKKKYPTYSLFGFKILSSWHSILCAYFLVLVEFLIVPYFGVSVVQYTAGLLFIFLINLSILILVINSLIRISRIDIYYIILDIPLLIYLPFSINKIGLVFYYFYLLHN